MKRNIGASETPISTITSVDDIPRFQSLGEEAAFWKTHELSESLWETLHEAEDGVLPPGRPRTRSVAVRFDEFTLQRMKALAKRRHKGYQTMLKEFVVERLYEEEKREGIVG